MKKLFLISILASILFSCKDDDNPDNGYAFYDSTDQIFANVEGGDIILPITTDQTNCKIIPDEGSEWVKGRVDKYKVILELDKNDEPIGREGTGYILLGYNRLPFKVYQRSAGINHIELINPTENKKLAWTATCSSEQLNDGGGVNMIFTENQTKEFWHSQWSPVAPLPHWVLVDLKEEKEINQVRVGWRQYGEKYYVNAKKTIIQISNDGQNFTDVGTIIREMTEGTVSSEKYTPYSNCSFEAVKARYVRMYITESNDEKRGSANIAYFKAYMP